MMRIVSSKKNAMTDRDKHGHMLKGRHNSPATEFKKGHIPFNIGRKQTEWMSPEGQKRTMPSRFQKGNLPHNTQEPGYVSCVVHRRKGVVAGYDWYINIDWMGNRYNHYNYRKYLWETFNGEPAPKGMVFVAKDGRSDVMPTIENIEAISRAELLRRNDPKKNR